MTNQPPGGFDDASTALQRRLEEPEASLASFVLVAIEGPIVGQTFTLDASTPAPILLGQSPVCEIRVDDRQVSRRHASIGVRGRSLRIIDQGSTNGTFVDGIRVMDAFLRGGEIIRAGATAFRVDVGSGAAASSLTSEASFGGVIGASVEMRRLYPLCERIARSVVPVIIEGETGTGKEVLAESIHESGPRASGPFVVFDCTAVPPSLVESELFGHERGAFTGAVAQRRGVFEQAQGGTLLIDEIGDLELSLQPKLLRVLERSEVRRVGGEKSIKVDVRVLAATRRDLDHEVQEGRFRDDLFHRLAVARIELPPLRERRGDVDVLARHFCRALGHVESDLAPDVLARWNDGDWPGNVRELRNAVARWLALGDLAPTMSASPTSDAQARGPVRPEFVERAVERGLSLAAARQEVIDAFEREYIERVLERCGGSVVQAAAASGIARRYFQILKAKKAR